MRVLIADNRTDAGYGRRRVCEALAQRGVDYVVTRLQDVSYRINGTGASAYCGDTRLPQDIDACLVFRTRGVEAAATDLVRFLTQHDVACVDPLEAYLNPTGKVGTLTRAPGHINVPETLVALSDAAVGIEQWHWFPAIVKPLDGCRGRDVQQAEDAATLRQHVARLFEAGRDVVVQDKLSIKDEFRVLVVGDRALAVCRRHGDQNSVAANVAQGGDLTLTERPDLEGPAIAAAQRNHYEICGVDLAETEDDLYLLEANRCPVIQPVEELGAEVSGAIVDLLQERASQASSR